MIVVTNNFLLDFHCHVDLYRDHEALIQECERLGVFTLAVTTTPLAWTRNFELTSPTRYVRAALGLHPQLVGERAHELSVWDEYLSETRYVGEIGLDAGPRFYRSFEKQCGVFEHILRKCARAGEKILTIHSVRAVKIVLDMLEEHYPSSRGTAVLHWFTGTRAEARRAVELGCYFSINSKMLENDKHRAMVASLPNDRLLTETDGPFVNINGRPVHPADVVTTLRALAELRGIDHISLGGTIRTNLKRILAENP